MHVSNIGSHVTLLFQTKYQTFTPAQFVKTFQELGFIQTKGLANISSNPVAPAIQTNIFSKDNLVVLLNPSENLIMFQIINTLDFNSIFDGVIQKILVALNFNPSSVNMLGLDCIAQVHEVKPPRNSLTSLVNSNFIKGLESSVIDSKFEITSLRITTLGDGVSDESMSVTLEPLYSDSTGSYHIVVIYRSKQNDKFDEFVKNFGSKMLEKIVSEVEKNVQ